MGIIKETANTQINNIHKWNACFHSESYAILTAKPSYQGDHFQKKSRTKNQGDIIWRISLLKDISQFKVLFEYILLAL